MKCLHSSGINPGSENFTQPWGLWRATTCPFVVVVTSRRRRFAVRAEGGDDVQRGENYKARRRLPQISLWCVYSFSLSQKPFNSYSIRAQNTHTHHRSLDCVSFSRRARRVHVSPRAEKYYTHTHAPVAAARNNICIYVYRGRQLHQNTRALTS